MLLVFDVANDRLLMGPYLFENDPWASSGAPTIGDYDGDGVPDIGVATRNDYYVFAAKCAQTPAPPDCRRGTPGVLWKQPIQDSSSGMTGSSTFDFNGDGVREVVYRDECFLRVLSGPDGKLLFSTPVSSGTMKEYPAIADADGDARADIIVSSDDVQGPACVGKQVGKAVFRQRTKGVLILKDPENRWMPTRPVWTSHTYHVTDIGDDLKVPVREVPSWKAGNDYRQNREGSPFIEGDDGAPLPDFTAAAPMRFQEGSGQCERETLVYAAVCNRGTATAPPGISGTVYAQDPAANPTAPVVCVTKTRNAVRPGACEDVSCDAGDRIPDATELWFRVNDGGGGEAVRQECKEGNNQVRLSLPQCEPAPSDPGLN